MSHPMKTVDILHAIPLTFDYSGITAAAYILNEINNKSISGMYTW